MNDMKKNIRRVFWLFFLLFAVLVGYLCKFIFFDSESLVANTYNPRLTRKDIAIQRGDILDRNGNLLATSEKTDSGYVRRYPYGQTFAHVVGFSELGKAGVESYYNFQLEKIDWEIWQRFQQLQGTDMKSNSIVLSLDADLQSFIDERLNGKKGAVVVMEPSTGKILSMASYPTYDPNTLDENWNEIKDDVDNSPLLNRATQGRYPPGSVFKILSAAAEMKYLPESTGSLYSCVGIESFSDNQIRCYDATAHGDVDLHSAFALSCNTYFATMGLDITASHFREIAEQSYFNATYGYPMEYSLSSFSLTDDAGVSELIQTSIGQGKTLVTPLHMAMITSAVANGGIMMRPYMLDHIVNFAGKEKNKKLPQMLGAIVTTDEAARLTEMMVEVMRTGTGKRAAIDGVTIAAKTGSAENAAGADHGWFVAFAPAEDPQIAISILLENCGGSANTLTMAKEILQFALNN